MPKFLALTNVGDNKVVDINMDCVESFAQADDIRGGTKLYGFGEKDIADRDYWRVKETPVQIRTMLNTSTSVVNVVNKAPPHLVGNWMSGGAAISGETRKPAVTTPIEYEVDGISVSEEDIISAVRVQRGITVKENRDSARLDKLEKFSENFSGVRLYAESSRATLWRNRYRIGIYGEVCESLRAAIDALKD